MQKRLLEAALFMSPKPLAVDELVKITGTDSAAQLQGLITELRQDYQQRGMVINETPFGYQMQVHYELLPKVSHLTPYADLSEGCKRTLALAVYKEPITQSEVIKIQGNKAYAYVKTLEDMDLVKAERYGRTKLLKLTAEFERYFGMRKEQVRALIEQQIGQPSPTNLNAFLPPAATETDETTTGLKQLFEGPKSVSDADLKALSTSLKTVTKKEALPAAEPAIPQLGVLDLWEGQLSEQTDTPGRMDKAAAPTQEKPRTTKAVSRRKAPVAAAGIPLKQPRAATSSKHSGIVPLRSLRPSPAHKKSFAMKTGTQTVLTATGAEKPDVPVNAKKKKARRRVMHKSAVKEETRDEKNIFSSEGEIKL